MLKKFILSLMRISALLLMLVFFRLPANAQPRGIQNQADDVYMPLIAKRYSNEPGFGSVTGTVRDARTDQVIADATVCYEDTICETTDSQGVYLLSSVPNGGSLFTANAIGYIEGEEFDTVFAGSTIEIDFDMLPVLEDGEIRVIVTWSSTPTWPPDGTPNDLNLHMWTDLAPPNHHIYIGNVGDCQNLDIEPYACYETDEQFGSGPDTIVVSNQNGNYRFAVLNYYDEYPGVPPIDELSAHLEIYNDSGLYAEYWVETASGEGDLWYVFDLSFFDFYPQNCLLQYVQPGDDPPQDCP